MGLLDKIRKINAMSDLYAALPTPTEVEAMIMPPIGADTYLEQLKDPRWKEKREKIFQRDGYTCFSCGSKENLRCHHKRYSGKAWEAPDDDLQTLCQACHEKLGPHPKGGVYYQRKGLTQTTVKIIVEGLTIAKPIPGKWVFFYSSWTYECYVVTPDPDWPRKNYLVFSENIAAKLGVTRCPGCRLVPYVEERGAWGLWPLKLYSGGWTFSWADSAYSGMRTHQEEWVTYEPLENIRRYRFRTRPHQLPRPEWTQDAFEQQIFKRLAGENVIRDELHPVYRELMGLT